MSRIEKLKARLRLRPKDFTYAELVTLLKSFGYMDMEGGKDRRFQTGFHAFNHPACHPFA